VKGASAGGREVTPGGGGGLEVDDVLESALEVAVSFPAVFCTATGGKTAAAGVVNTESGVAVCATSMGFELVVGCAETESVVTS
jgi:hypothetical protein